MLLIRLVLEPCATIAVLGTMPLVFLGLFSNYAWICFTGGRYCEADATEGQLQSDKDVVILLLFLSISLLSIYEKMVKTPHKVNDRLECLKTSVANCICYKCK